MPPILCRLFGHRRNSRLAHLSNDGWLAPCMMCGTRLARESHNRWRVVSDDGVWPSFAPYARAPRQPFKSAPAVDAASFACDVHEEAGSTPERGCASDSEQYSDESDRTRRLLRELLEQSPMTEPTVGSINEDEPRARATRTDQRVDEDGQSGGGREQANSRSEAEMFAIAFAGCREMLFRLSDHFSLKRMDANRANSTPPAKH